MVLISTFVIFDIETTGLPKYELNQTKIVELTFLAVDRRDIETASIGHVPLLHKLSYLFNPQRPIQKEASNITGLTDAAVRYQPTFKNRIQSITSFLEELRKPVCLVAHNGNSFDFKILRTEFIDANASLPNDLLCVDSLWGFKKILKQTNLCYETLATNSVADLNDDIMTDDEDSSQYNAAEEWDEISKLVDKITALIPQNNCNVRNDSPVQVGCVKCNIHVDKPVATRRVFQKKPKSDNVNCTLQALYKRFFNKEPVNAHRSEADCLMLLECIVAIKDKFLPYAFEKCKLISDVEPLVRIMHRNTNN